MKKLVMALAGLISISTFADEVCGKVAEIEVNPKDETRVVRLDSGKYTYFRESEAFIFQSAILMDKQVCFKSGYSERVKIDNNLVVEYNTVVVRK